MSLSMSLSPTNTWELSFFQQAGIWGRKKPNVLAEAVVKSSQSDIKQTKGCGRFPVGGSIHFFRWTMPDDPQSMVPCSALSRPLRFPRGLHSRPCDAGRPAAFHVRRSGGAMAYRLVLLTLPIWQARTLLVTSASLVVTSALLVVTRSY